MLENNLENINKLQEELIKAQDEKIKIQEDRIAHLNEKIQEWKTNCDKLMVIINDQSELIDLKEETYQLACGTKNDLKLIIKLLEQRLDMVYESFLSTRNFFDWLSYKFVGGYKMIQGLYGEKKKETVK